MIEPTDEMIEAFGRAECSHLWMENTRAGLVAVLAIVERDYDVSLKLPPVEHRLKRAIWWNHYSEAFQADCVCGEEFTDRSPEDAEDRLLTHMEREAAP